MTTNQITLKVDSDFDGYFEALTKEALKEYSPENISKLRLTAGAYRTYDVRFTPDDDTRTMTLDFYSAGRFRGAPSLDELVSLIREADEYANEAGW